MQRSSARALAKRISRPTLHYELTNLKDGKWRLKIKAKGYKKGKAQVEISGGKTYEQNFELRSKKRNSYFLAFKSKKS
jgi:uncharacterized membrane protein